MPNMDELRAFQRRAAGVEEEKKPKSDSIFISVKWQDSEEVFTIRHADLQIFERVIDAMELFKHEISKELRKPEVL